MHVIVSVEGIRLALLFAHVRGFGGLTATWHQPAVFRVRVDRNAIAGVIDPKAELLLEHKPALQSIQNLFGVPQARNLAFAVARRISDNRYEVGVLPIALPDQLALELCEQAARLPWPRPSNSRQSARSSRLLSNRNRVPATANGEGGCPRPSA